MYETLPIAQNPLILRFHRFLEAFAKSDDERDFYLDKVEGFLLFIDLDKSEEELLSFTREITAHGNRYSLIPKMTYFETKKFMEGFVNEKVYDIDTKEKLLDIIGGKEARENFLEFIYDHPTELEKWQQYYHERSRIRVIEWLRGEGIIFVFEEDIELLPQIVKKLKNNLFETKVSKEIQSAREILVNKSKIYYSNEALNPRPKRGRPPKQVAKVEIEPQLTPDLYTTIPSACRPFLFMPEYSVAAMTFSAKFDSEAQFLAMRGASRIKVDSKLEALSQRLESLRHLSNRLQAESMEESRDKIFDSNTISIKPSQKKSKVFELAKGLMPKKRGRPSKKSTDLPEEKRSRSVGLIRPNKPKKKK